MNEKKNALVSIASKARNAAQTAYGKAAGVGTGLMVMAGSAMAGGGTSPGSAIAAGLDDGPSEMGLVFAGVAVLIGLLLLWTYVKRSAK